MEYWTIKKEENLWNLCVRDKILFTTEKENEAEKLQKIANLHNQDYINLLLAKIREV